MSFWDRIKSIAGDAGEKIGEVKDKYDDVLDKAVQEIKDKEIKLMWYVHKRDQFKFVRVVDYNPKRLVSGSVKYRTIQHVREIENTRHFSVTSADASKAHDTRDAWFNSEETNDLDFRRLYQHIEVQETLNELEARYQEVLRNYGERLLEFEDGLNSIDTTASRADYNNFLGIQEPAPRRSNPEDLEVFDTPENEPLQEFSGSTQTNMQGVGWGYMEEARRELEEKNAKIKKQREKQDNSEPEIVLKDKKRLENIE